jgi:hypothetical protein
LYEVRNESWHPVLLSFDETILAQYVVSLDIAKVLQASPECLDISARTHGIASTRYISDPRDLRRLLRFDDRDKRKKYRAKANADK